MTARVYPTGLAEEAVDAIVRWFDTVEDPISCDDLTDIGRDRYTFKVRATVAYFLKTEAGWSYPRIGRRLGRDHSTVINMVRRIPDLIDEDDLDEVFEYTKDRVAKVLLDRHTRLEAM